jgi:phosphoglycolate phosphatase-like HAD superfamily hydrolase
MESEEFTGRPDATWTEAEKAAYERLKAKVLAEMPDEPHWLDQPTVPFDDVIELLDRLEREAAARGDQA